jgi:co-chaperonin GroES (HSP10)
MLVREGLSGGQQNDEWLTVEGPDPDPLPRVPGVSLLVRPVPVRSRSQGGIIIPDTFRDDMEYLNTVGRVLVLGDLAYKNKELYPNGPWCSVGDYVVYGKYAGSKIIWKGVKLLVLPAKAVELVVERPEYLDSNFKG